MSLLTSLSIIGFCLQLVNMWWLSKGRIVYPVMAALYLDYALVESILAIRDPEQWGIWLFAALSLYAFLMSLKGWLRWRNT